LTDPAERESETAIFVRKPPVQLPARSFEVPNLFEIPSLRPPPSRPRRDLVGIGVGVGSVLLGILIGVVIVFGGSSRSQAAPPTPTAQSAPAPKPRPAPPAPKRPAAPRPIVQPVEIRLDSEPAGAAAVLVDAGKPRVLGTTPLDAQVDSAKQYDVVLTLEGRLTHVQHLDPARDPHVFVMLAPDHAR
jgi:hypothetical protein